MSTSALSNALRPENLQLWRNPDPDIRDVVRWLNDNGFDTHDSGDGKAKFTGDGEPLLEWESSDPSYDCVMPFPHVFMSVVESELGSECNRLRDLLLEAGVPLESQGPDVGAEVSIQGTYDPMHPDYPAFIMLIGLTNEMLEA